MLSIDIEKKNTPKVVLVGQANVGKSTLFNALMKKRLALVGNRSGVTRDRRIGTVSLSKTREICFIDTGGWVPRAFREAKAFILLRSIEEQIKFALKESALVLHVVDVRLGLSSVDSEITTHMRKAGLSAFTVCNKCDSPKQDHLEAEFYALGRERLFSVSAAHHRGLGKLWRAVEDVLEAKNVWQNTAELEKSLLSPRSSINICSVGRPNVGKSSFLNCLLGLRRLVSHSSPGTTTDSVDIAVHRGGKAITLVDTPGIRRYAKRENSIEQLAVMQAKRSIERAELSFLVLDVQEGISSQDIRMGKLLEQSSCATIIIANKWDLAPKDIALSSKESLDTFVRYLRKTMPFLDYAPVVLFSAKKRKLYAIKMGLGAKNATPIRFHFSMDGLWSLVNTVLENRLLKISTGELNKVLQNSLSTAPAIGQTAAKIYFAHQVSCPCPTFCAYVKYPSAIPDSYKRYLIRNIRESFGFSGNPIRWVFKDKRTEAV